MSDFTRPDQGVTEYVYLILEIRWKRLCQQIAATNQKMRGIIITRGNFEGIILIFKLNKYPV